ncbi:MAG: GTP-binding protein, partial [Candidatus Odinarchaeota archaeon]|nr:GTP-binding protein [Candidatus Odinarchaeota archaeon]
VIAGHVDHGKSSLIEAITGTFPDYHEFEIKHEMTVLHKVISFVKKRVKINFIDTPGHLDFRSAINAALLAADGMILVVSAVEGIQSRTEYLLKQARDRNIPILIAATKMNLPQASIERVELGLRSLGVEVPIVATSSKEMDGIEELIEKSIKYFKVRRRYKTKTKVIFFGKVSNRNVEGFLTVVKKGILRKGKIGPINVKGIYDLDWKKVDEAIAGEVVYVILSDPSSIRVGDILEGDVIEHRDVLSDSYGTQKYIIRLKDSKDEPRMMKVLKEISDQLVGIDYRKKGKLIEIRVTGRLQFNFLLESIRDSGIDVELVKEERGRIITVGEMVLSKFKTALVEILPITSLKIIVEKSGYPTEQEIVVVKSIAGLLGLNSVVIKIISYENFDDLADAILKGVEKAGIFEVRPSESILIKTRKVKEVETTVGYLGGEILRRDGTSIYALVPMDVFNEFIDYLLKRTSGFVDIKLVKSLPKERILAIDPGTKHIGLAYIEGDRIPELFSINLSTAITHRREKERILKEIEDDLKIFLRDKPIPTKVFVGNGVGCSFILDFLKRFYPEVEDIFIVDEEKSSKEAIFKVVSQRMEPVSGKTLVDHAVAALLIARRGMSGRKIPVKKARKRLEDYIVSSYETIGRLFKRLGGVYKVDDLRSGTLIQVRDPSYFKTNVEKGEIFIFRRIDGRGTMVVNTLTGSRLKIKFKRDFSPSKDFFKAITPVRVKSRTSS